VQCPRCQTENREGRRFCAECGLSLGSVCEACGFANEDTEKFCGGCGKSRAALMEVQEGKFSSPRAYTPTEIAERILTSKAALEGERKQVTVLFADLRGSMELLADRDPEEARQLLDSVLERMMEAVHHYEGTVNQVMGDGIMALFGAPLAHEDHAVRACYAALRMQEAVKRYAVEAFRSHGITVRIRVGLNSGEVVVRSIRSDLRMDYTAVGQTTHLAARMEQLAPPGAIWITAETRRLVESFVQIQPVGTMPVRGLETPVEVSEVIAAGRVTTRFQAAVLRGLSQFVGRNAEMEQLESALEEARQGRGRVVAVVGDPGMGKSRLFHELTHSDSVRGCRVLQTSCLSYGQAKSYRPVIDLLRAYFRIDDRDDLRSIRAKITGHVLTLDESLRDLLPPIFWLFDVLPEGDGLGNLEPPHRRQVTLDALERLLWRESRMQPLVLVVEDLHWIDPETQALLDSLVDGVATVPVLALVNYRPEHDPGWQSKPGVCELRIAPLVLESAEALLEGLVGQDPGLVPLKRLLIERTEGNPFFLEESVHALAQTGALVGERGAYRLTTDVRDVHVPATVQALLAARIDRLPPEDKRLLQAASVIGRDVPVALLGEISGTADEELRGRLARLEAAGLFYEARLFPEHEYTFKHALTHEVTHASLLQERRRGLHRNILEALERRPADQPAGEVEVLARHAVGAEAWDRAVEYLREAGRKTIARSSYVVATELLNDALRALGRLPETRDTLEHAIDARLELRIALAALGRYQDVLRVMREAEGLAVRLGDRARLGRILADICARLRNVAGEHRQAIEVGERAIAIAADTDDRELEFEAQYRTGQAYFAIGEFGKALELLSRCVARSSHESSQPSVLFTSWAHSWLALTLSNLGRFEDARAHAREAVQIAEAADHPFTLAEALAGAGSVSLAQGDLEHAFAALERARGLIVEWRLPPWAVFARLGYAHVLSARPAEARRLLAEVIESASTMSAMGVSRAMQLGWLSEAYLLEERLDEALTRAQEALSLTRRHGERNHEAWCLRLLGQIASHHDPVDVEQADGYYREALALADSLGARPLAAHCHLHLGEVLQRTGRWAKAHEHLRSATRLYREMDMRFWLARAEAGLQEPE